MKRQSRLRSSDDDYGPRKPARKYSRDLLERTKQVWQPRTARQLTDDDAREIIENMVGFFRLLHEWRGEDLKDVDDPTRNNGPSR